MRMVNGIRAECSYRSRTIYSNGIVGLVRLQLTLISFSLSLFCPLSLPWVTLYRLWINICFSALELQLVSSIVHMTISLLCFYFTYKCVLLWVKCVLKWAIVNFGIIYNSSFIKEHKVVPIYEHFVFSFWH